jgi:hypothetical protein
VTAETVLMWSAAVILASLALAVAAVATFAIGVMVREYINRYRIRGLTGAQIRYARRLLRRFRDRNESEGAS